jgi:Na+/proline symporter
MSEIGAAAIGALALLGIPIVAWLSKRATREGRLLLRAERLGVVYSTLPDSKERESFKAHVVAVVDELNSWMDVDKTRSRRAIRAIWIATIIAGTTAAIAIAPLIAREFFPWLGVVLGLAMSAITQVGTFLIERRERTRSSEAKRASAEAEMTKRLDARRRGDPVDS